MSRLRKTLIAGTAAMALAGGGIAPALADAGTRTGPTGLQMAHMAQGQQGQQGRMPQQAWPMNRYGGMQGAPQMMGTPCPMAGGGQMGMMGPGMMMAPGMQGQGMMGPGMQGQGMMMGPGSMMGQGGGFGMMGPRQSAGDLSGDDVRQMLEGMLAWHGNDRVKVGEVKEADEDTVVAEIVTQDGSLVQRLRVDRHTGSMQHAR